MPTHIFSPSAILCSSSCALCLLCLTPVCDIPTPAHSYQPAIHLCACALCQCNLPQAAPCASAALPRGRTAHGSLLASPWFFHVPLFLPCRPVDSFTHAPLSYGHQPVKHLAAAPQVLKKVPGWPGGWQRSALLRMDGRVLLKYSCSTATLGHWCPPARCQKTIY